MIISHKHKFIFLKTRKTAGTSIEIALSQFCGNDDVITPIADEDERKREELGFLRPRNYEVPLRYLSKLDWVRWIQTGKRKQFFNHVGAQFVRDHVGEDVWRTYFKFCFERNPFDKAISRYYWSTREPRPALNEYFDTVPVAFLSDWPIYTINDQIAVDFVGRYERFADDLAAVAQRIGLPEQLSLPKAKGEYRTNRAHYSDVLDAHARARIELVCAKEITALDYRWTHPASSAPLAVG